MKDRPKQEGENQASPRWVDVHTHLNMLKLPVHEALKEASGKGINSLVTIGTEPGDWDSVLHWASKEASVKGALGLHPHKAHLFNTEVADRLRTGLKEKEVVACGEVGLDYHYDFCERGKQKEVFFSQMSMAEEMELPVEIHSRSAEKDTLEVLDQFKGRVRGLLHCFTGTWDMAKGALDKGFDISFSGIVTFKNATEIRDVCRQVPLNRLHIETDAPYLSPVPYRGKSNQPAYLVETAAVVARLHGVSLTDLSTQTLF